MSAHPTVLAVVQAGGKGSRLDVLTRERAKPTLPFGGSYQLVDIALSNLVHSGITDVWLSSTRPAPCTGTSRRAGPGTSTAPAVACAG
jgi:ADP-glucose pyrophosphorylase